MKNLLLLLLFPAFFAGAQNQAWQPDYAASVNVLTKTANQRWLVAGMAGDPTLLFGSAYIAETAADGFFRENHFNLLERSEVLAALPLPDGRLLVAGSADGCDFGFSGFIRLLDANGLEVWTAIRDIQTPGGAPVPRVTGMVVSNNGELIAVGEQQIQVYDLESGGLLLENQIASGHLTGIIESPAGNGYMVCGSAGVYHMDDNLNLNLVFNNNAQFTPYIKIVADDSGLFSALRSDGKLYQGVWVNGSVVHTLHDPGFKAHDLFPYNKGLALCGRHQGKNRVDLLDSTLLTYKSFILPDPDLFAQRIHFGPDGIVLAGVEMHGPSPRAWFDNATNGSGSRNFWLQQYTFDGAPLKTGTDAALSKMLTHTLPKATPASGGTPWPMWSVAGGTFSVQLENAGSETLNEVHILAGNYGYDIPFICPAASYVNFKFDGLGLAPGADTTIYLGHVGTLFTQVITPWKLCFWVTTPNGKTDLNHDNDFVCWEFKLISADHEPETASITLFPNPAKDVLFLRIPGESPGLCRVFNAAGQLAAEQTPVSGPDGYTIDVSRLPAGFYWLQSERGQGRFVKM